MSGLANLLVHVLSREKYLLPNLTIPL